MVYRIEFQIQFFVGREFFRLILGIIYQTLLCIKPDPLTIVDVFFPIDESFRVIDGHMTESPVT